jgi:hypothetical protein
VVEKEIVTGKMGLKNIEVVAIEWKNEDKREHTTNVHT